MISSFAMSNKDFDKTFNHFISTVLSKVKNKFKNLFLILNSFLKKARNIFEKIGCSLTNLYCTWCKMKFVIMLATACKNAFLEYTVEIHVKNFP